MESIIKINIKGPIGIGKSTICECIKDALKKEGLTQLEIKGEDTDPLTIKNTYSSRIKKLKEKNPNIRIEMSSTRGT